MASVSTRTLDGGSGLGGSELLSAENLLRVYPRDGSTPALATVPGFRRILARGGRVNGIYRFGETETPVGRVDYLLLHIGTVLYAIARDGTGEELSAEGLADAPSFGFRFGGYFYLLDGTEYRRAGITRRSDGTGMTLTVTPTPAYLPTEYVEGEAYEMPNLLSDTYRERFRILSLESIGEGSRGLRFEITDAAGREARLVGGEVSGELRIPSYTRIGDEYYRVASVAPYAFEGNGEISSVRLGLSVGEVGEGAFRSCTSLVSFSAPGKLRRIGYSAFAGCTRLETLELGAALETVLAYATSGCTALSVLRYAGASFSDVTVGLLGNGAIEALTPECSAEIASFEDTELRFPLSRPAESLLEAALDGEVLSEGTGEVRYRTESDGGGRITSVILCCDNPRILYEKSLSLTLSLPVGLREGASAITSRYPDYTGTLGEAVRGCRVGAVYDGRIFLSGNPRLPGTVFYTARCADGEIHAGYLGLFCHFAQGSGETPALGLLPTPSGLYVFTAEPHGCGIYRRVGQDTGDALVPRIYPVADGHGAEGDYRASVLYRDEVILVTSRGVSAICRDSTGGTRLHRRDEGFARLSGLPDGCAVGIWLGYLTLLAPSGEAFLADGRRMHGTPSGGRRPEWWYLRGIHGHAGDAPLYRYATYLSPEARGEGHLLAPPELQGEVTGAEVWSSGKCCYVTVGGKRYAVSETGERVGGEALGFTAVLWEGDDFLFGDASGAVLRFSTDKRGLPPTSAMPDFDSAELARFRERYPDYLAPEWYSFDGHAISVRMVTALDDCGAHGMLKSTEVRSTLLDCSCPERFSLLALTEDGRCIGEGESTGGEAGFLTLSFESFSFADGERSPIKLRETTKKWHRKQYVLEARGIGAPIAVRGISYRYTVVGKVK